MVLTEKTNMGFQNNRRALKYPKIEKNLEQLSFV
jgi:hypothetical protein